MNKQDQTKHTQNDTIHLKSSEKYDNVKGIILWYGCLDYEYVRFGNLFTEHNKREAEKNGYYTSRSMNTGREFKFGLDFSMKLISINHMKILQNVIYPNYLYMVIKIVLFLMNYLKR